MSMALWGTVGGALVGSYPCDKFGRKRTLLLIGFCYFFSAIWTALSPDVISFIFARFLGGLGVGMSTVAAPLYISEIAPAKHRGKLSGSFSCNVTLGILVAYISNVLLVDYGWRFMLGVEALPAFVYTVMCFRLPESPRWLICKKGDRPSAVRVLLDIYPYDTTQEIEDKADQILSGSIKYTTKSEQQLASKRDGLLGLFCRRSVRKPLLLAFWIAFFNQLSGINAVLYFAPRVFELAGLDRDAALIESIGIGLSMAVATAIGLFLIDRTGRRSLMLFGATGHATSLGLCAWAFYTENFSVVPVGIFFFIFAHTLGQGIVLWVFLSEIFPSSFRAQGQSFGSTIHWVMAAVVTMVFPIMVDDLQPSEIFLTFSLCMCCELLWVILFMPETKGRSLDNTFVEGSNGSSSGFPKSASIVMFGAVDLSDGVGTSFSSSSNRNNNSSRGTYTRGDSILLSNAPILSDD